MRLGSVRRFSNSLLAVTQSSISTWFWKAGESIHTYIPEIDKTSPTPINDIIRYWTSVQPNKCALSTEEDGKHQPKVTFSDIHTQSVRLADVLMGNEFQLIPGKTVLTILPSTSTERITLQLACLLSGLIFCPCDPKELAVAGVLERIQKLAVDCVITNDNHLQSVKAYTDNPLRPLKKGLITYNADSKPLPVGWIDLLRNNSEVRVEYEKDNPFRPDAAAMRLLTENNEVMEYSRESFHNRLMSTARWLSMKGPSALVWMKNHSDIDWLAPLLFGSTILQKETETLEAMINTLGSLPVDTLCASAEDYQLLTDQRPGDRNYLNQLFSVKTVDPTIKLRWYAWTGLHLQDAKPIVHPMSNT